MGCWNETCVLTRLPIHAGERVVALTVVHGPKHYRTADGFSRTALLFGLPQTGHYDDYGGIESPDNPALQALTETAFGNTGLYRSMTTQRPHGGAEHRWLAASADTFWGHAHHLKHLFYARHGVQPGDEDAYDARRDRATAAYKDCERALEETGKALGALELPQERDAALAALFGVVQEQFGAEQAWAAFDCLRTSGLFAQPGVMLMHEAAYRSVVAELGARTVRLASGERLPLREALSALCDETVAKYESEREKWTKLLSAVPDEARDALLADEPVDKKVLRFLSGGTSGLCLGPLSSMWTVSKVPLLGHFWDAVDPRQALEVAGREAVLDFFVFQWTQGYLRNELTVPSGGSQNSETVLRKTMLEATFAQLSASNRIRRDFDGYIG